MAANKKKWKRWLALGIVLAVLGGGIGFWYLTRPPAPTQAMRSPIINATVTRSDLAQTITLNGTLTPTQQANLNFSVSGEVTKVYVKVGDQIKKGDNLARIDSAQLTNAVDLAKANLKSAEASYTEAKSGSTAAKDAAKARVDSAKAALDSAKKDLEAAVLRSTITGTVAQVGVAVGDQVGTGGQLSQYSPNSASAAHVVVIATSKWKLEGSVSAADLRLVETGQSVKVTLDSSPAPIDGKVTQVGIVAESVSNGTAGFPVTIELDGEHPQLFSGTSADAQIIVDQATGVLSVPTAAISQLNGKAHVTRMVDGNEQQVAVTTGRVFGENTEILEGLAEGDEVIIQMRLASSSGDGPVFMGPGMGPVQVGGGPVRVVSGEENSGSRRPGR